MGRTKPQVNYVIGVDTSAGISEGHLAAIEVFRVGKKNEYPVQVAEWAGYKDPLDLAQDIALIGHYYNNALVAVEINNTGIATQGALQKVYFYQTCIDGCHGMLIVQEEINGDGKQVI